MPVIEVSVQESRQYTIRHGRHGGQQGCTVSELLYAIEKMPNGWRVVSLENRDDGTTVVQLQAVKPC